MESLCQGAPTSLSSQEQRLEAVKRSLESHSRWWCPIANPTLWLRSALPVPGMDPELLSPTAQF